MNSSLVPKWPSSGPVIFAEVGLAVGHHVVEGDRRADVGAGRGRPHGQAPAEAEADRPDLWPLHAGQRVEVTPRPRTCLSRRSPSTAPSSSAAPRRAPPPSRPGTGRAPARRSPPRRSGRTPSGCGSPGPTTPAGRSWPAPARPPAGRGIRAWGRGSSGTRCLACVLLVRFGADRGLDVRRHPLTAPSVAGRRAGRGLAGRVPADRAQVVGSETVRALSWTVKGMLLAR